MRVLTVEYEKLDQFELAFGVRRPSFNSIQFSSTINKNKSPNEKKKNLQKDKQIFQIALQELVRTRTLKLIHDGQAIIALDHRLQCHIVLIFHLSGKVVENLHAALGILLQLALGHINRINFGNPAQVRVGIKKVVRQFGKFLFYQRSYLPRYLNLNEEFNRRFLITPTIGFKLPSR
jgi:hypothetical protein